MINFRYELERIQRAHMQSSGGRGVHPNNPSNPLSTAALRHSQSSGLASSTQDSHGSQPHDARDTERVRERELQLHQTQQALTEMTRKFDTLQAVWRESQQELVQARRDWKKRNQSVVTMQRAAEQAKHALDEEKQSFHKVGQLNLV